MEDFNTFDDVQTDVVDQSETEATTSEVTEEVTTEPVVETAKPQSAEENARFAAARRAAEAEKNALKAQNDRLMQALGQYGYQGSPEEIADTLMAQTQGISIEEATAQREAQEYADFERMQIQGEAEFYKNIAIEKMMADDLTKIKEAYPDVKVKHLKELGNEFFSALNATKDAVLAYDVIQTKKARETKPIPRDIGAVNSSSSKEKDFYTSAEVDKLTSKDYDNPRIMERVRQSMLKW
jgi:hypothetical protein